MNEKQTIVDQSADYRDSHVARGATYDAILSETPFDAYMADFERDYLKEAIPRLFPGQVPRYLDFACGTARITQTVAPFAKAAVGVDISPSMLEQARRKCPTVTFVQADLTQGGGAELGKFSLITSFRFFGNAQHDLREAVLRALSGMLEPGGYLVINSHRNPKSLATMLGSLTGLSHDLDLSFEKLKTLLQSHGLSIVSTRPIGFWMYRAKIMNSARYGTPGARRLESMFSSPAFTPWAPDAVIIAKKTG